MELTEKELTALVAIANSGCEEIGAESFAALLDDNMTWFNRPLLSKLTGFTPHEAAGVMSALESKGLAVDSEPGARFPWALTVEGIKEAIAHA